MDLPRWPCTVSFNTLWPASSSDAVGTPRPASRRWMQDADGNKLKVATAELCHLTNGDKMTYFAVNPQDANIQFDSESRVTSSCLPSCRESLWQLVEKTHELCPRPLLLSRFWTPWWGDPRRLPGGSIKCLSPCQCRQSLLVSCVLPTTMWTFCLSVAAHLCCDLTGEKIDNIFLRIFNFP